MKNEKPLSEYDVKIGARIRTRREELRITQARLASGANVTFQQIQKYERGINRISVERLAQISQTLRVNPAYFMLDLHENANDFRTELASKNVLDMAIALTKMDSHHVDAIRSIMHVIAPEMVASKEDRLAYLAHNTGREMRVHG